MSMFRRGLMLAASQTKKNPIYGVKWVNDETTTMERTDDSAWLSYTKNYDNGSILSDFNSVFPWNEAKKETLETGEFLHMPDMYFRIGVDENGDINSVAVSNKSHEVGNWYKVDSFYYGLYGASENGDKLASLSGKDRLAKTSRGDFRTKAKATGAGYFQLDLYHKTVMMFLWWIEWATKNSRHIMEGKISTTGEAPCQTGGTDEVNTPSGFNTTTKQMRYHYIEDFVGNFFEWIDGVSGSTTPEANRANVWVSANPDNYVDINAPANYKQLAYITDVKVTCITAFGWDSENPFLCYFSKGISLFNSAIKGFTNSGDAPGLMSPVVFSGSSYDTLDNNYYGVCHYVSTAASISRNNVGGRLLYKPQLIK